MNQEEIKSLIKKQKDFFLSGKTLEINTRIQALRRLKNACLKYEREINNALTQDLGKSSFEGYMCESGLSLNELSYMLAHTKQFAKEKRVATPLAQFASRSYKKPSPYGTVLILSPWNYPFLLSMDPLIDAISAGNTVILKPSAYSPNTSAILEKIIKEVFPSQYVCVVQGGRAENSSLLKEAVDYIFFTGSQVVGKEVMRHASEHLTPVTLELGGKSPCIVDKSANLSLAAKRIVFGKFLNCGQTCVAPDYLYCHASVKDALLAEIKKEIVRQFGADVFQNPNYGKIINEKHFNRIRALINPHQIAFGGKADAPTLRIYPTILDNVTWEDAVMQEEIFGPILPVLTFDSPVKLVSLLNSRPHPLALYIFAQDKAVIRLFTESCQFGGGCINDTIIHLATTQMGFGGVGASGMGSYHGKTGFDTFTHYKNIVDKKTWLDLPMRYQPYTSLNEKMIRFFLK